MSNRIIRWGFTGCGNVVETKSGKGFQNVQNSEIHAILRRDIHRAQASAKQYGCPFFYDDIHDLLANPEIDAVYINTPPGLHYEQAMLCCKARKAAYIEKPLARNLDEASRIVRCFTENDIPLFVAHYRRALPRFIEIKRILDSGEIGKPLEVCFRMTRTYAPVEDETWMYNPVLSGGGRFFDVAPHTIDILIFLFGDFVEVAGSATNNRPEYLVEDMVVMSFKTQTGVVGTVNFNSVSDVNGDRMTIYGTSGTVEFSMHADDTVTVHSFGKTRSFEMKTPEYIEEPLIATVVAELLGYGYCPSRGMDALPSVRVIDTVLDSYYGGRQRDFWNHPSTWSHHHGR